MNLVRLIFLDWTWYSLLLILIYYFITSFLYFYITSYIYSRLNRRAIIRTRSCCQQRSLVPLPSCCLSELRQTPSFSVVEWSAFRIWYAVELFSVTFLGGKRGNVLAESSVLQCARQIYVQSNQSRNIVTGIQKKWQILKILASVWIVENRRT